MLRSFIFLFSIIFAVQVTAFEKPVEHFPLARYSQDLSVLKKSSKPLLPMQRQTALFQNFYEHLYGNLSPWDPHFVLSHLHETKAIEMYMLEKYDNRHKTDRTKQYSINLLPLDKDWWDKINKNIDLDTLAHLPYNPKSRAIVVTHTLARELPTAMPAFYHPRYAGEGFPFDNLQVSSLFVGTAVYEITQSRDKLWSLVLTGDGYIAWIQSHDIAYTSENFVIEWRHVAKQSMIAITKNDTSISRTAKHKLKTFVGQTLPGFNRKKKPNRVLVPVATATHQAKIKFGSVKATDSAVMPVALTKSNMVKILKQMHDKPYGWGGSFFANDCSQEMKYLFASFGIWFPRNSGAQSEMYQVEDLSELTPHSRVEKLIQHGKPFITLISLPGHIMLYVGKNETGQALTYQNVWGLHDHAESKRFVIGHSVLLPLLIHYTENPDIESQASKERFKLITIK